MSLKFLIRGKFLFINTGAGQPIPFVDWANKVVEHLGVPIECQAVQGANQAGNFSVGIGTEGWKGVANFKRVAALVDIYRALEAGGIEAEGADGSQVLNLSTAGPRGDGERGRYASRCNLFLNLGNQAKAQAGTGGGTTTVVNSTEDAYTANTEAYIEAGGDFAEFCENHGTKPIVVQSAMLKALTRTLVPASQNEGGGAAPVEDDASF